MCVVPGGTQIQQQAERERSEHEQRRAAHATVEQQLAAAKGKVRVSLRPMWAQNFLFLLHQSLGCPC